MGEAPSTCWRWISMATQSSVTGTKPELKDPLSSLRSPLGFSVSGERQVNKPRAVCWHFFKMRIRYICGNTSNFLTHLKRHHPTVNITRTKRRTGTQLQIPELFKPPLASCYDAITNANGFLHWIENVSKWHISVQLHPYYLVVRLVRKDVWLSII